MIAHSGEIGTPGTIFLIVVALHGLFHLIGVVREWDLGSIRGFTGETLVPITGSLSLLAGFLWLVSFLCFTASWTGLIFQPDLWWIPGLLGVVISQLLIIVYWRDAKAGTFLNILIFIVAFAAFGQWSFLRESRESARLLLTQCLAEQVDPVTREDLRRLPAPVQRWLIASGVEGRPPIRTVRLLQTGKMRTEPDGSWMPTVAEQVFTTCRPAFIWTADVTMAGIIPIAGRDSYRDGKGNMLIKAFAHVPIVDARGDKIDQGSMLRYLGELVWFPTAALSSFLHWREIDDSTARASLTYGGEEVSADFRFDSSGNVVSCSARRYKGEDEHSSLEEWFIPFKEWRRMDGLKIPTSGEVVWKLPSGEFTYYVWEIAEVAYDDWRGWEKRRQ